MNDEDDDDDDQDENDDDDDQYDEGDHEQSRAMETTQGAITYLMPGPAKTESEWPPIIRTLS